MRGSLAAAKITNFYWLSRIEQEGGGIVKDIVKLRYALLAPEIATHIGKATIFVNRAASSQKYSPTGFSDRYRESTARGEEWYFAIRDRHGNMVSASYIGTEFPSTMNVDGSGDAGFRSAKIDITKVIEDVHEAIRNQQKK